MFSRGKHPTSGSMKRTVLEVEAPIVTEVTRDQDHPGGHEDRQHIPRSEEDQDPGLDLSLDHQQEEDLGLKGQCRGRDRRVYQHRDSDSESLKNRGHR